MVLTIPQVWQRYRLEASATPAAPSPAENPRTAPGSGHPASLLARVAWTASILSHIASGYAL